MALVLISAAIFGPQRGHLAAQENLKASVQFYIKAYGLSDPGANILIKRTYEIFDQVQRVADKRGYRVSGLKIVNNLSDPWTIALPDGHIILSVKAVEICYQGVERSRGDARMAFILGHELAHLANNDFWHMETFMALSGDQDPWSKRVKKILIGGTDESPASGGHRIALSKKREMEADDTGFVYAAIAGFPVDTINDGRHHEENFFTYWMNQAHTQVDVSHPHPMERARLLQARLSRIKKKIDFFQFGVRLAHFGRYEDAVYFLQDFQKTFPSREVFNNLGYCYLKLGIKRMPSALAYEYWLPSVIDLSTRAERLVFREKGANIKLSDAARDSLRMSVSYFEKACFSDTMYVPSRLNLSVAYFYLGDIYKARAAVEEALKLEPDHTEAKGLRALIMYHEAPDVDMWPHAIKLLKELSQRADVPPGILYNLAILLEKRKRSGEAQAVWERLVSAPETVPGLYEANVCRGAGAGARNCLPPKATANAPFPWRLPVKIGSDLLKDSHSKALLDKWNQTAYDWQNKMIRGHIYLSPNGSSALVVNDFVEMVVLRGRDLGTVEELTGRCGNPFAKIPVHEGEVWSYGPGWSVLIRDMKVHEVWVSE